MHMNSIGIVATNKTVAKLLQFRPSHTNTHTFLLLSFYFRFHFLSLTLLLIHFLCIRNLIKNKICNIPVIKCCTSGKFENKQKIYKNFIGKL